MHIIVKNDDQSVSWKSPRLLGISGILTETSIQKQLIS